MLGLAVGVQPVATQSADFDPPRLSNGNPDFNGIWQVLNTANYDIEPHIARRRRGGERRGGSNIAYRRALVGVRYALESDIGLRLPVEMRERYRDRHGSRVEGIATYTNFRRFQVQVEESAPFRD